MNLETALTRRDFIKAAGLAGAAVAFGSGNAPWSSLPAAEIPIVAPPAPSWVDKPMRWAQLTLVEDDPGKFDLSFWLDYFHRTRSDAVCLSAGGCVAYYPTRVPFHHRSQWLGDRDVFGELVAGCRKLGMVVIARTDPHATYDDARQAHPAGSEVAFDAERKEGSFHQILVKSVVAQRIDQFDDVLDLAGINDAEAVNIPAHRVADFFDPPVVVFAKSDNAPFKLRG